MHRFFVTPAQVSGAEIIICGADVNHIKNVLRMKPGEHVTIKDGVSNTYLCQIAAIEQEQVRARILATEEDNTELPVKIYLFQGIPKGDKMEMVIQKAVELGVYQIIPVVTRRTVVKLEEKKAAAKVKRWNSIAESAARQSGRRIIPQVTAVKTFQKALSDASSFDINYIPYELAEGMEATREALSRLTKGMQAGVFIGPEGGFDAEEIELACANKAIPITLGRRILRTETASLTALSMIMFQLEQ